MTARAHVSEQMPLEHESSGQWREHAACRSADPELFFAGGAANAKAKRLCASCPVRRQCLDDAIGGDERFGIWGGMSSIQRTVLKLEGNPVTSQHSLQRAREEAQHEQQLEQDDQPPRSSSQPR